MGLTINYKLSLLGTLSADEVKKHLNTLRQRCLDIPLQNVSAMMEFTGEDCDYERHKDNDDIRWLLIHANHHYPFKVVNGKPVYAEGSEATCIMGVTPLHVIAFSTLVGPGCESAEFGLCRLPQFVTIKIGGIQYHHPMPNSDKWTWYSFCKTQYASDPRCGGIPNFVKCHLIVIKALDIAKEIGFDVMVNDEGDYWNTRDHTLLLKNIGAYNEMIAGMASQIKDAAKAVGMSIDAPITDYPNYEHLEADSVIKKKTKDDKQSPAGDPGSQKSTSQEGRSKVPKTNIKVKLIGEDGNAFAILGRVKKALIKGGHPELVDIFMKEATAKDYDNLLRVVQDFVIVE